MNPKLNNLTDEELFLLVKGGDSLAYTILYNRFKRPLLVYATKKIGSQEALDVTHDVLAKIWSHKESIIYEQKFSWYIFHILKNRIIDKIGKSKHSDKYLNSLDITQIDYSINETDLKIRQESFWKEIDEYLLNYSLNAKTIIQLNMDGYSNHEIAEKLNLSEKTIRNQKSKIFKFLRSKLPSITLITNILAQAIFKNNL